MKCLDRFKFDMQPGPSLGILGPVHKIFYGPPSKSRLGGGGGGCMSCDRKM